MSSISPPLTRGAPLPHLHFALGGDLYLSPFADGVSLRRYTSFGSDKLYPSATGRLFSIEHWKFILKLIPRISVNLNQMANNDYLYQSPYSFQVAVRSSRGSRRTKKVAFLQQNRSDLELTRAQFQKLVEHGKEFVKRPLPVAASSAAELKKKSHKFAAPTVTITLDENCRPVEHQEQEEEEAEEEGIIMMEDEVKKDQPAQKKKKPQQKREGGWTAPPVLVKRRNVVSRGKQMQSKTKKCSTKKKSTPPSASIPSTSSAGLAPPKPLAIIPPKFLLCDEVLPPSPLSPPASPQPPSLAPAEERRSPSLLDQVEANEVEWLSTAEQSQDPLFGEFGVFEEEEEEEEEEDATASEEDVITLSEEEEEKKKKKRGGDQEVPSIKE